MTNNTGIETFDMTLPIPVFTWNGWTSQDVSSLPSRDAVFEATAVEADKFNVERVELLEDGEFTTTVVTQAWDYRGWRQAVTVFTTRPGAAIST